MVMETGTNSRKKLLKSSELLNNLNKTAVQVLVTLSRVTKVLFADTVLQFCSPKGLGLRSDFGVI